MVKEKEELTALEQVVISAIPADNFYDGFECGAIWSGIFCSDVPGLNEHQVGAVLVSLQKKGFVDVTAPGESGYAEGTLDLTEKGKAWLKDKGIVNENGFLIR